MRGSELARLYEGVEALEESLWVHGESERRGDFQQMMIAARALNANRKDIRAGRFTRACATLIAGARDPPATRTTAGAIGAYIRNLLP
jgi:hypothetical protein